MSYLAQTQLESDPTFQARVRAVNLQQGIIFRNDERPDITALAYDILRDDGPKGAALLRAAAAGPGIAELVDNDDGTVDQSKVTDADLLSLTQANWPGVAALYYDETGTPLPLSD
jgi:hypothetical protein